MSKISTDEEAFYKIYERVAEDGIRATLGEGERILKEDILNRPGSGKIYRRGGKEHQASADGEAPAPDLDNLRANTNANPDIIRDGEDFVGLIVADAEYAEALEKGTERMAARPYFGKLENDYAPQLEAAFRSGAGE